MEAKRLLDVLDKHLAHSQYLVGDTYTIADMAAWPWYGGLVRNTVYEAAEFLDAGTYKHVLRWANAIAERPAVRRGIRVNRTFGPAELHLPERHAAADFDASGSK